MDQAEEEYKFRTHECLPKSEKAVDVVFSLPAVSEALRTCNNREVIANCGHTQYSSGVFCGIADIHPGLDRLICTYHEPLGYNLEVKGDRNP